LRGCTAQLDFGFYGLVLHGLHDFCMFYLQDDDFSVAVVGHEVVSFTVIF
jgi:hypothetical protein